MIKDQGAFRILSSITYVTVQSQGTKRQDCSFFATVYLKIQIVERPVFLIDVFPFVFYLYDLFNDQSR